MQTRVHHHSPFSQARKLMSLLTLIVVFAVSAFGQSADRNARAAQWESYKPATGKFVRFVDRQKGYVLWHPADWKERPGSDNIRMFMPGPQSANLLVLNETIPEGFGVTDYTSSYLQGLKNQATIEDSLMVRRVMMNGLEWREVSYDIDQQGTAVHQTVWLTAIGARAYGFALTTVLTDLEKDEPILKRTMLNVRIGAAGHWNEEFETLRQKFVTVEPTGEGDIAVANLANELRTAKLKLETAIARLTELFAQPASSAAALDLLTDADPQIRAAAISALGKTRLANSEAAVLDVLVWALGDKDAMASAAAASALAERGTSGVQAIKAELAVLAATPAPLVRFGLAAGEPASSELITELLRSSNGKQHLAAMMLALTLPKFDQPLPLLKLLTATEPGLPSAATAVLQKHFRGSTNQKLTTDTTAELVKLLRGDQEWWAARALGELAEPELRAELEKRIAEIDTRLMALGKTKQPAAPKPPRRKKASQNSAIEVTASLPPEAKVESFSITTVGDFKSKPEDVRLALARGELDTAVRKMKFRDQLKKAKSTVERQKLTNEFAREHSDLSSWARTFAAGKSAAPLNVAELRFDAAKMANAPTTGETVFPKNSISYVMSPNLNATMEKLDAALSGVQMGTVRDQMTLALILKLMKTNLADKTGVSTTGDASTATGIDLKAPIAIANWGAESADKPFEPRSAVVLRVHDRARFERLLLNSQDTLGDLNSVTVITAALSRFAGLIPAAVPVVFAAVASGEGRRAIAGKVPMASSRPAPSLVKPFALVRQEKLGEVPVTVFDKFELSANGGTTQESLYLAYLGETAVLASSQAALIDALQTASGVQPAVKESAGYLQVRREQGEIVFFSDLKGLLNLADTGAELDWSKDETINSLLKAFGAESGALRLTPNSWDTVFNIGLGENEFTGSFKPFKANALAVPRELLPASTTLYAGAVVDPAKLFEAIKKSASSSASATMKAGTPARTGLIFDSQETDDIVGKQIVPELQGEIGAAILSFKPLYEDGEMPAFVFAARLKSGALAAALKSRKLFPKITPEENVTALGSPVLSLGTEGAPYIAITDQYLLLADSPETLKLLEISAKEKFSTSRDFVRSLQNAPDNLALFATYNLEAAFDEAAQAIGKGESQEMMPFISALVHAFHSQRAFVTLEKDGLRGNLSVSFDREGRFAVGDLAARSGEFDVANASIRPKGLTIIESTRVESMSLKIAANRPGVAVRVRDDLAKFPWQKIQSSTDNSVTLTTNARRIPETATVTLPVSGAEFAKYLAATPQINSNAPEVLSLGKQIAGNDKDGRSVARKIGEWTHQNLKWKKVQSDVVETLASREADCLEHSELYVALARSLGLPARVVTGAALGGGSFGAHAWVEVYLGKWVELDPTWGLMDHVDATHLRFDGDAFTSYAMLNQIELEVTAARRAVAEYQRDPIRLVKEFSLDATTRDLAFDLSLTVEQVLGADRWNKLDDKQRAGVVKAFERTVAGMWETWNSELPEPVRVLRNEAKGDQKVLTVLRGEGLFRLTLTTRDGAWYITEHESLDDAFQDFADAITGSIAPESRRGRIYEISLDGAMKHVERIIAAEGEKPELLLLKSRILASQRNEAFLNAAQDKPEEKKKEDASQQANGDAPTKANGDAPTQEKYLGLLKQIARRWPNFAPGQLALGRELASTADDGLISMLNQDTGAGIVALKAYAQLVPDDPRVWRELAQAYEHLEKPAEAEAAYRAAIQRDNTYLDHHAALVNFLLDGEKLEQAKAAFAQMLKASTDADEVFEYLDDGEGFDADSAKIREALLLAFPKEVAASQSALRLLADLQEAQNKIAEAIKSIQRVIAIEATTEDYESLSRLYRQQRRFTEALAAANQALKLDDSATYLQFERACSLAQLGRKREAITALKEALESESKASVDLDEPDLKPLAIMPEFKALKEKLKEDLNSASEKPVEQPKPAKP